jgi:eukaryotic-like serine/threonine-protein kinase
VHRDLSPDNVILPGERIESAKLIDFGICKLTDPAQETIIGSSFAGKYRYASPEQLGLYGGGVDARSDIYSLGLILAAAALGRPLGMGESIEAALRSRQGLPDLSALPPSLREWLSAMLQPDPARRPDSLDALLARWPAETGSEEKARPRGGQGGRGLKWGIGLPLLAGVALGLYWILRPLPPDRSTESQVPEWGSEAKPESGSGVKPESGSVEPPSGLGDLARAGRLDEAFALAQQGVSAGRPPPVEDTWALAQGLIGAGRLDQAFALVRELANGGFGPAAFALGEMYDPLHWSSDRSPFSKPNGEKARDWYRRADQAGVAEAGGRLRALDASGEVP